MGRRLIQNKWIIILQCIEKGQRVKCPWCTEAEIQLETMQLGAGDNTVFMSCPACGRTAHFSHYKKKDPKGLIIE